ncbi:uncharacterized protein LOC100836781 [Brachypodium distachyon]|uniref:Uncharacterized protein n=1 Tax=Brachypodium distachyon TaxID=15368 RepID=I1IA36_BRADI|nr:uncharacterized protein LOC100836781 [Brachypodium distachyon]KQJ99661.1 hypothetical protein BRADI_3g44550v3 [Brachypodium distachyon]|eukprot:XP_003572571.1 uncharacterized protein LOC100836781 [Brachypodium distachyon]
MENRRRCSRSKAVRRLRSLLALASDYLKYLFMNRRRLLRKVANRTLAVLSYHGKSSKHLPPYWTPRLSMEHEFSCSDSPCPAFLAAKKLQSRLKKRGAAAGAAISSCFGGGRRASYEAPPLTLATEERKDDMIEEEEEYEADGCACCELEHDVDCRAEEFINMFYAQLRAQN